jgi:putative transposase
MLRGMARRNRPGEYGSVGNADLGLEVRPDHMNVRWIVVFAVQGDLIPSEILDCPHHGGPRGNNIRNLMPNFNKKRQIPPIFWRSRHSKFEGLLRFTLRPAIDQLIFSIRGITWSLIQDAGWDEGQHPMSQAYSLDLRERVVAAVEKGGLSARQAAAAVRGWRQHGDPVGWTLRKTGGIGPSKIGGYKIVGEHSTWLLQRIKERDFTLRGLVAELAARGLKVDTVRSGLSSMTRS